MFSQLFRAIDVLNRLSNETNLPGAVRADLRYVYLTVSAYKDDDRTRRLRQSDLADWNQRLYAALCTEIRARYPRCGWDAAQLAEYCADEYGIRPDGSPVEDERADG